ncbi:MAG: thiamine biosynthesis protein [bacterium]|nr:thiamine biosynthesis protein [bacterium]
MTSTSTSTSTGTHALGLLSGGLDSMLAAELLRRQGIKVTAIIFQTPFFGSTKGVAAATQLDIPYRIEDITVDHLVMVKSPHYGYGKNMNPCIDCHAMMFAKAGELMEELGAHFLFSGEVLGQRPMSQNLKALKLVEEASGYQGLILRPLSAKLLLETDPERDGLVDRKQMLDIQGRSRKRQMQMAQDWGLSEYPAPGGGCLLTDPGFSVRLDELFDTNPSADPIDVEKLKLGRHFRLPGGSKAVVGRHHKDNEDLKPLIRAGDIQLKQSDAPGPLTILDPNASEQDILAAAALTARYTKAGTSGDKVSILVIRSEVDEAVMEVQPMSLMDVEEYRVG